MPSGNGREEHHRRDGRREPGLGGGRRDLGRVWNPRAEVYGGEPRRGAEESLRRVCGEICGAREIAARRQRTECGDRYGAVYQRTATEDGDELRRDWEERRREAGGGREAFAGWRFGARILSRADDFQRLRCEDADLSGRDFR